MISTNSTTLTLEQFQNAVSAFKAGKAAGDKGPLFAVEFLKGLGVKDQDERQKILADVRLNILDGTLPAAYTVTKEQPEQHVNEHDEPEYSDAKPCEATGVDADIRSVGVTQDEERFVRWEPYDENHSGHQLAYKAVKNFNGEPYVPVRIPFEEEYKVDEYFAKTQHLPPGVGPFGEGPEKAFWLVPVGFKVTRMSTVKMKKLNWLWKDRIPAGALSTIAGDPDCGKSLLSIYLTACVTNGWKFYGSDQPTAKGDVLFLTAEDDPETTIAPRLKAAGANLTKVHLLQSVLEVNAQGQSLPGQDRLVQLDTDIRIIKSVLAHNPGIKLIIIDPISSFLGGASMVKEQEVRRVLNPLVVAARDTGVTVVMVAHFNKNGDTRAAMDRVGGAKALVGLGRAAWTCVREPKPDEPTEGQLDIDRVMFLKLKNNLAPSKVGGLLFTFGTWDVEVEGGETVQQPFIQFLGETTSTAHDVVIEGKKAVGRPKTVEACIVWLKEYLVAKTGCDTRGRILGAGVDAGFSERTIERAKSALELRKSTTNGITYWVLPGCEASMPQSMEAGVELGPYIRHGGARPGAGRKRNTVDLGGGES